MDYIIDSEDEEKEYLETQNLIHQGKKKKDVEEEKLCRVGWQVNNCFTVRWLSFICLYEKDFRFLLIISSLSIYEGICCFHFEPLFIWLLRCLDWIDYSKIEGTNKFRTHDNK